HRPTTSASPDSTTLTTLAAPGDGGDLQLPPNDPTINLKLQTDFGKMPLAFEANQGQTDASVQFLAHGKGYNAFIQSGSAVFVLAPTPDARQENPSAPEQDVLRLQFVDANPASRIEAQDPLPGRTNYFLGNDRSKWVTDVPTFGKVVYHDYYPGIDLV